MCATQPIARTVRAAADKEENRGKPRFCFYMSGHEAPAGLFRHWLTGVHELRQRVRPIRAAPFSAPESRGARTALACSPLTGGEFSAEIQRGFAYPAGAQEGRHLRFPPSCESPLSLGESGANQRTATAPKRGTAEDFFYRVFLNIFAVSATVLLHRRFHLRRRDITVSRNSSVWRLRTAPAGFVYRQVLP